MSEHPSRAALARAVPIAGRWPMLERIPRRRFLRMRREGRILSLVGALLIAALVAGFVEPGSLWPHALTVACGGAWVVTVTRATKRRWLRWLRRDFAAEVGGKLDGIRRAAPFN